MDSPPSAAPGSPPGASPAAPAEAQAPAELASRLPSGAIRRWRLVLTGCIGLIVLSALAWRAIPRLEDPRVDPPEAQVILAYPGAAPEDVESQVIKVVEERLYSLEGVESVESSALPNLARFHLKFEEGTLMDVATERIRGRLLGQKKELPAQVKDPEIYKVTTAGVVRMIVAVTGYRSDDVLTRAARRLKDNLAAVPGVSSISLVGARQRAVRVRLDPHRLARHGLSVDQVVRRIQEANVRIPAGELTVASLVMRLQIAQEFDAASSLAEVPLLAATHSDQSSQTVYLRDVAEISDSALGLKQRFLYEGQPAVAMNLYFQTSQDAEAVSRRIHRQLEQERRTLPPGTRIVVAHDQGRWISRSISNLEESLAEGVALVMLIITLGVGWRCALVVAGVLPLAVGGAILGLYLGGFALEQVSIGGLIVALGLLVDDAVVVTESIQLMRDKGLSAVRAAVLGTSRVFWANNATTAVACATFLPLFFMGGSTGAFIRGLPTAVVLSLVISLLVSQMLTPFFATLLLRSNASVRPIADSEPFDRQQDFAALAHEERNPVLRYLREAYSRRIGWVVENPLTVIILASLLLLGSVLVLPRIGFQFFPKADRPLLFVSLQLHDGAALEATQEKLAQAVALLHKDPATKSISATLGLGYPSIFLGRTNRRQDPSVADILLSLRPDADTTQVATRLRRALAGLSGVLVNIEELYFGPPLAHPIIINLFGDDYARLRRYAEEVETQLQAVPGTLNVTDNLAHSVPLAHIRLDTDRALRLGLAPSRVGDALRMLYGEDKITEFRQDDELVQVTLDVPPAPAAPLQQVEETPIRGAAGALVPLRDVSQIELRYGAAELRRRNTRRMVEITSDVDGKVLPASVIARLDPFLRHKSWEAGYGFSYAGAQKETTQSFQNLGLAALGAILLVFLLLLLLFDSWLLSVVIVAALPYALIGAFSGLFATGNPFGFMAFLGLIALIGVYVNHKIYFVDRMHELMGRGQDLMTAIRNAGRDRLRPVVLTALTAVLGLFPLTLGGGVLWSAFGWVNICGLLASIPLSLILLPAFVSLGYRSRRRPA